MRNGMLTPHTPIAIAKMNLFFFQIAMLAGAHEHLSWEHDRIEEILMRTYMRSTINREEAMKAR